MNCKVYFSVLVASLVLLTACGMEPSGGSTSPASHSPADAAPDNDNEPASSDKDKNSRSADALPLGVAALPAEFEVINTDEVTKCHSQRKVFNRRTLKCSQTIDLATSFECNKDGIVKGFGGTGYQIDLVLSSAEGDGFIVDQCGETVDGFRYVFFVRADEDGSFSIREIETTVN